MTIVAKAVKGHEYFYSAKSAHMAAKDKASRIADKLNEIGWSLKDGETWFVYEVGYYDTAYGYAEEQSFTWGKTGLKERRPRCW